MIAVSRRNVRELDSAGIIPPIARRFMMQRIVADIRRADAQKNIAAGIPHRGDVPETDEARPLIPDQRPSRPIKP